MESEEATNHPKEGSARPIRVWSRASGRSERTHAPGSARIRLHGSRRHRGSGPGKRCPTAGLNSPPAGSGLLPARRPGRDSPLDTNSFQARPGFPRKWGGGKRVEGPGEEGDTNPTSWPERDAGGSAISSVFPAPTLGSHPPQEEGRFRRGGGAEKGTYQG